MFSKAKTTHRLTWVKRLSGLCLIAILLLIPLSSFAEDSLRATKVYGELDKGYSKHYLALEPTKRDALITVNLIIEPQDVRRVANRVNFLVLTDDGLRRVQAGDKPEDIAFATGHPSVVDHDTPPKQIFNKTTSIKASGRGVYTVIVYSRAPIPTTYTLSVENAEIVDESGQVTAAE